MDEVELLREDPGVFGVVYFEGAVGGDAGVLLVGLRGLGKGLGEGECGKDGGKYFSGWIGLRSVPITWADGCRRARWVLA